MRVALATCAEKLEPDPDEELLLAELRRAGVAAEPLAWDGPAPSAAGFDLCVLRSTWNYHLAPDAFRAWLAGAGRETRVENPLRIVGWNLHKGYLCELERRGVPTVPTLLVARGARDLGALEACGRGDVVVKPAVSASSWRTRRFGPEERGAAREFLAELVSDRDALVQPYLRSVEDQGERALVWIDGAFTHAIQKAPRLAGGEESVSEGVPLEAEERAFAERLLAPLARRLLYARVDLMRDAAGGLRLSELELAEPSLYLLQSPAALGRLARAIVREAGQEGLRRPRGTSRGGAPGRSGR